MTQGLLFAEPAVKPSVPGWPCAWSPCRGYRYTLWRIWSNPASPRYVNWLLLNPSTADESEDDPTIRRCIGFTRDWGFDGLCVTNLFAFRATDPAVMKAAGDPVGDDNDYWICVCLGVSELVIAAWGIDGAFQKRDEAIRVLLSAIQKPLHVLKLNKDGSPLHPLYAKGDLQPVLWERKPR